MAASSLFALTNEEILGLYKNLPHNLTVDISKRTKVENFPEVEMVVIEMSDGNISQNDVIFVKDNFLIQDLFDTKAGVSYREEFLYNEANKKISQTYKSEDDKNIIKLGNDASKPTSIIFVDPKCPHCQDTVDNLEIFLEKSNLEIISLSFIGGDDSAARNAKIYEEVAKEASDSKKIEILKKYYSDETATPKASQDAKDKMFKISENYSNAGIYSVPRIVNKEDLNLK